MTDIRRLAGALWERACLQAGVDSHDPRLRRGLQIELEASKRSDVAEAPPGSEGVRWLADRYLASLPRKTRSIHGRYYTPGWLADALAAHALESAPPAEGLFVDPACGSGSLLTAVVERASALWTPAEVVGFAVDRLRGVDLDEHAVQLCDLAVRIALLPAWSALPDTERPSLTQFAEAGDGLADYRPACAIISNPPFGRARLAQEERNRRARALYGHAHWPTVFLHDAIDRLVPGGVAAFVLPASIVGGLYYRRLREFLMEEAPPSWIAFVNERAGVFTGDVLQEALLSTFRRGAAAEEVAIQLLDGSQCQRATHRSSVGSWTHGRPWLMARGQQDVALVDEARTRTRRLRDYGWSVATGPLVWNRHRAQLHDEWSSGRLPVIWASDVRDRRIVTGERSLRYVECSPGQEWLVLSRPAVLVQRTTAPEQRRRLVAGVLDAQTLSELGGRVVVENHLNVCTWDGSGSLSPAVLIDYLMGAEADRLFRCMSGSVAVSAFELGELPLPDFAEAEAEAA